MNPVIDHYRCVRCRRVREATNIASRRPLMRSLACDACDQVTTHSLTSAQLTTPTTQETTTMTTTSQTVQTTDPRKPGWTPFQGMNRIELQRLIEKLIEDAERIARACNETAKEISLCAAYDRTTQGWNRTMGRDWFPQRYPEHFRQFEVRGILDVTNSSFVAPEYSNPEKPQMMPNMHHVTYTELEPPAPKPAVPTTWRDWSRFERETLAVKVASELRYMVEQINAGIKREDLEHHRETLMRHIGVGTLHWSWFEAPVRKYRVTIDVDSADAPDSAKVARSLQRNIDDGSSVLPAGTRVGGVTVEERADVRWRDLSRQQKLDRVRPRRTPPPGYHWQTSSDDAWTGGDEPMPCSNLSSHGSHHYHPASGIDYWCPGLVQVS